MLLVAFFAVAIGIAITLLAPTTSTRLEYDKTSKSYSLIEDSTRIPDGMVAVGSALIGAGVVSIALDFFNRRESEAAVLAQAEAAAERTKEIIATQTVAAVVGDPRFVQEVLTDERRREYLQAIILANLDDKARPLAERTAAQFSGRRVLRDFRVRYLARDRPVVAGERPCAELITSFLSNERPSEVFRYRFIVLDDEHDAPLDRDPDVFTWTYRRVEGETTQEVLDLFEIKQVSIDGIDADLKALEVDPDSPTNEKRVSLRVPVSDRLEYLQEVHLRFPPPRQGSYVFFQPGQLTLGIDIRCEYTESAFTPVVVEALQTDNVREVVHPQYPPHDTKGYSSSDWVLPSASVAMMFYTAGSVPPGGVGGGPPPGD